jgi:hypothetical protein
MLDDRMRHGAIRSSRRTSDSVKAAGNVVLPADATFEGEATGIPLMPDSGYQLDTGGIPERRAVFLPFQELADAASGLGHNLFILDSDGPIRHVVPFVRTAHRALPSLGVAAALRVAGIGPANVTLDGSILRMGDRVMPLVPRRVDTSDGAISYLWGLINFRGPALLDDLKSHTYPTTLSKGARNGRCTGCSVDSCRRMSIRSSSPTRHSRDWAVNDAK